MRRKESGFTLIELLIVISIIALLAAVLLPEILGGQDRAYALADQQNLSRHFQWLTIYKAKHKHLPNEGGHKFVLATWTSATVDHTEENFDVYFTPGPARDNDGLYQELRKQVQRGENPWPELQNTSPTDTHYAGRAKESMRTVENGADEAWMADDNEGIWSLRDGTINILLNGGKVRSYSYQDLQELFSLGPMDKNVPVQTWGPNSPIPACKTLAN